MAMQGDALLMVPKPLISSFLHALQGHTGLGTTSGGGPDTQRAVRGCPSPTVYSLSRYWTLP